MVRTKTDLYSQIENEGFFYYFSAYGPEKPENVPEDIRALWVDIIDHTKELGALEDELMLDLESAYDENEDTFA